MKNLKYIPGSSMSRYNRRHRCMSLGESPKIQVFIVENKGNVSRQGTWKPHGSYNKLKMIWCGNAYLWMNYVMLLWKNIERLFYKPFNDNKLFSTKL